MQLDTVQIKINETEENRKNYELNIAHLKEEELERFFYMENLRQQTAETNALFRKMDKLRKEALMDCTEAEKSLQQFQEEIDQFHVFAQQQLRDFERIFDVRKEQNSNRELNATTRADVNREKTEKRIAKIDQKKADIEDARQETTANLDEVQRQLAFLQERFQRIAGATGLDSPDAIINKFHLKEEIRTDLTTEIDVKKTQIEEELKNEETAKENLQNQKLNFTDSKWRDVDKLQDEHRELQARASTAATQVENVTRQLAFLQEGLTALFEGVSTSLELDADTGADKDHAWTSNQFQSVLSQFNERVSQLQGLVKEKQSERQKAIEAGEIFEADGDALVEQANRAVRDADEAARAVDESNDADRRKSAKKRQSLHQKRTTGKRSS